jgi:hypothetical protein
MKRLSILLTIFLAITISDCWGLDHFQRNRKAFQRWRFNKTTAKYNKACSIFQKKRSKGGSKPFINLGLGRKAKSKQAEQD